VDVIDREKYFRKGNKVSAHKCSLWKIEESGTAFKIILGGYDEGDQKNWFLENYEGYGLASHFGKDN
jgi:hypothetical protein